MTASLRQGDALTVLHTLPDGAARCCVTSPPYWGLRDYGHAGQLGLERTPEEYVANMVAVFREVRRVLADDGTLWLNLGDSYTGYWGDATAKKAGRASSADTNGWTNGFNMNAKPSFHEAFSLSGLKPKNLVGIPWRVAFALQADGWYLRSDIIWAKPNPMPESVTDRPTKSHEYLFLLAKAERYYYNADAVAEPSIHAGAVIRNNNGKNGQMGEYGATRGGFMAEGGVTVGDTRNARTVWTIPTMPYKGAHFATFPEELARRCILAGSSAMVCEHCGAAWKRVVERDAKPSGRSAPDVYTGAAYKSPQSAVWGARQNLGGDPRPVRHGGYAPTCDCKDNTGSASDTILDPFGGSGTVAQVATGNGRSAIHIDLNPAYIELARHRVGPMLCTEVA